MVCRTAGDKLPSYSPLRHVPSSGYRLEIHVSCLSILSLWATASHLSFCFNPSMLPDTLLECLADSTDCPPLDRRGADDSVKGCTGCIEALKLLSWCKSKSGLQVKISSVYHHINHYLWFGNYQSKVPIVKETACGDFRNTEVMSLSASWESNKVHNYSDIWWR